MSSHFDYGPRAGFWRIMRVLDRYGIPSTASCAGRSIERAPWLAQHVVERGDEVACHSYRWERHSEMSLEHERRIIGKAVEAIERACGERPVGWHTRGAPSPNTRRLLVEEFGFLYDSDAYDDDLPYLRKIGGQDHVIVPYAFDTNDMGFMAGGKFADRRRFCPMLHRRLRYPAHRGRNPSQDDVGRPPSPADRPPKPDRRARTLFRTRARAGRRMVCAAQRHCPALENEDDSMNKILLTGFEPYGNTPINPAEQVATRLDGQSVEGAVVVSSNRTQYLFQVY